MKDKVKKQDTKEQTTSDSSGSFVTKMGKTPVVKRKIGTKELKEMDSSVSANGQFDVPIGGCGTKGCKHKDPLHVENSREAFWRSPVMKNPKFPKFVKGGKYIKIKSKCQDFPYCNQGAIDNPIEYMNEEIKEVARTYRLPVKIVEKIVLKEIKRVFI